MSGAGMLWLYRLHRTHDLADRPAGDTVALLRKARAVFMLRARRFTTEAAGQVTGSGQSHYRRAAARELRAARLMHRLIVSGGDNRDIRVAYGSLPRGGHA